MKRISRIALLAIVGVFASPVLADHEQHGQGREEAASAPADMDVIETDMDAMDDGKSGGKSCKKCKMGMGGGGHDHGGDEAGGHEHGDDDAGKGGGGGMGGGKGGNAETEALKAHVRQLEKRIDLIQTMLEMLTQRRGGGGGASEGAGAGGGHH